jgi:hypothetical protein
LNTFCHLRHLLAHLQDEGNQALFVEGFSCSPFKGGACIMKLLYPITAFCDMLHLLA